MLKTVLSRAAIAARDKTVLSMGALPFDRS